MTNGIDSFGLDPAAGGSSSSRSRMKRETREALTGCPERMATLPHLTISNRSKHVSDHILQDMEAKPECNSGGRVLQTMEEMARGGATRKCVYNYEDKYSFARILVPESLVFDSHFESGNLFSAFRVWPEEPHNILPGERRQVYDLYMHNDVNTTQHTQWFYFGVSNIKAGTTVTFFIRNYSKPDSMFNEGMRPLLYSAKSNKGWLRAGYDVCYFYNPSTELDVTQQQQQPTGSASVPVPATANDENGQGQENGNGASSKEDGKEKPEKETKKKKKSGVCNYTLAFTHTFEYSEDMCYFSYCHPYTYTDLQMHLEKIRTKPAKLPFYRQVPLCTTLAGNVVDVLTITAPSASEEELRSRVAVLLTARVHPGETNASWIMHGMLDYLTGDSEEAQKLRRLCVFKIVPMLNPDGVINGNYRTSLSGEDLNRRWSNPDPHMHPEIHHTKRLLTKMKKIWTVGLVLDVHGHSRKHGVFVYGCVPDRKIMKPLLSLNAMSKLALQASELDLEDKDGTVSEHVELMQFLQGLQLPEAFDMPKMQQQQQSQTTPENGSAEVMSTVTGSEASAEDDSKGAEAVTATTTDGSSGTVAATESQLPPTPSEVSTNKEPEKSKGKKDQQVPLKGGSKQDNLTEVDGISLDFTWPTRTCSLRDVLAWRVKLLPRIIGAAAPTFSLDNCSFRMQKGKASTMRMVAFTELGIDCCYTIEASLAGKGAFHFSVGDLMEMGENVCQGLLTAFPSMAPSQSPHYAHMQNGLRNVQLKRPNVGGFVDQLQREFDMWKPLYKPEKCAGSGMSLLSEQGLAEMSGQVVEKEEKDEEESDGKDGKDAKKKGASSRSAKNAKRPSRKQSASTAVAVAVQMYTRESGALVIDKIVDGTVVDTQVRRRSNPDTSSGASSKGKEKEKAKSKAFGARAASVISTLPAKGGVSEKPGKGKAPKKYGGGGVSFPGDEDSMKPLMVVPSGESRMPANPLSASDYSLVSTGGRDYVPYMPPAPSSGLAGAGQLAMAGFVLDSDSRGGATTSGSGADDSLEVMGDSLDQERAKQNQKQGQAGAGAARGVKPKAKTAARPRLNTSPIRPLKRDGAAGQISNPDGTLVSLSARSIGGAGSVAAAYKSLAEPAAGATGGGPLSQFKMTEKRS